MNDRNPSRDDEITHTSVQQKDGGRLGLAPGEDLSGRDEFAGRKNVTEERQHQAMDPHQDPNA
jgi:hypothetical protein